MVDGSKVSTKWRGILLWMSLLLSGCGPAQPPSVPPELEAYVSEGPGGPFLMNPAPGTYIANLAKGRPLTPEKQKEVFGRLVTFGHIGQLIVRNQGESVDGLKRLTKLEGVHLSFGSGASGKSVDLQAFRDMPQLKEISVGYEAGVQLSDAQIAVPAGLVNLSLYQLPVASIDGLENCKSLQVLDVSFIPRLENVTSFRGLGPLKKLKISESTLTRISEASVTLSAELLELTETSSLAKTKVQAVEASVFGKENMTRLDGIENWVGTKRVTFNFLQSLEDISSLERLSGLEEIVFDRCKLQGKDITQADVEPLVQKLPGCKIFIR